LRVWASMTTLIEVLERAREVGFLGPGPVEPHVTHAEGFAQAFPVRPNRFVDLGSGGGVPGLVLAGLWPSTRGVLLDSNERRTDFLAWAVGELGLGDRVHVVRNRAEAYGRDWTVRGKFDAAVARGFAPPPVTAECAAPLLAVGGLLVVSDPPDEAPRRWPQAAATQLGLSVGPVVQADARYQVLTQVQKCPDRYPRRVGIPAKRPLW
jgi:16S rRNA (guanine527-N7)-methyltransferase